MSEIRSTIQHNISVYRKQAGLTQGELAEKLHVKKTSLASWEQGKSLPDIDTLFELCNILQVNIATISGFQPPKPQHQLGGGVQNAMNELFEAVDSISEHSVKVGHELAHSLSADETQLITDYRSLNEQGQEYIRQTMYMAKQTHKKMPDLSDLEKQA